MSHVRIYRTEIARLPIESCASLLDCGEKQRANHIVNRCAAEEFVKTRALLRLLLSISTGQKPNALQITVGEHGKPFLAGCDGLHFSTSHSKGIAFIAIAPMPVGIDIEWIDSGVDLWHVAEVVFSPLEIGRLRSAKEGPTNAFFSTWTRKEAYLKANGDGLGAELKAISISSPDGEIEDRRPGSPKERWRSLEVAAPTNFKAALATPHTHVNVEIIDLSN